MQGCWGGSGARASARWVRDTTRRTHACAADLQCRTAVAGTGMVEHSSSTHQTLQGRAAGAVVRVLLQGSSVPASCVRACVHVDRTVQTMPLLALPLLLPLLTLQLQLLRARFRLGEQFVCHLCILRARSCPCCGSIWAILPCRLLLLRTHRPQATACCGFSRGPLQSELRGQDTEDSVGGVSQQDDLPDNDDGDG